MGRMANGLRTHLGLLMGPAVVGSMISLMWYHVFFTFDWHFQETDESAFTDTVIPIIAMFHAIVAGHILNKVWEEYKVVRRCLRDKDKDTFLRCRDDRIPIAIHLLLGSMSVVIQVLTLLVHFEKPFAGIAANFSVAFVLTLYWKVATNLDNPLRGAWYKDQIPKDWFE